MNIYINSHRVNDIIDDSIELTSEFVLHSFMKWCEKLQDDNSRISMKELIMIKTSVEEAVGNLY